MTLIARRALDRAGTRHWRRGTDTQVGGGEYMGVVEEWAGRRKRVCSPRHVGGAECRSAIPVVVAAQMLPLVSPAAMQGAVAAEPPCCVY